jgi:hypothetical protein
MIGPPFFSRKYRIYSHKLPQEVLADLSSIMQPTDTTFLFGNKPFIGRIEGDSFVMRRLSFIVRRGLLPKITGKVEAHAGGTTIHVCMDMQDDLMKLLAWLLYLFQFSFVLFLTQSWIVGRRFSTDGTLVALVVFLCMFLPVAVFNGEAIYANRVIRNVTHGDGQKDTGDHRES